MLRNIGLEALAWVNWREARTERFVTVCVLRTLHPTHTSPLQSKTHGL